MTLGYQGLLVLSRFSRVLACPGAPRVEWCPARVSCLCLRRAGLLTIVRVVRLRVTNRPRQMQ